MEKSPNYLKGVPLRVEVGEKELSGNFYTVFRRDTKERYKVIKNKLVDFISTSLNKEIPKNLYQKINKFYEEKIKFLENLEDALEWIKSNGVTKANWCGSKNCYEDLTSIEIGIESIGYLIEEKRKADALFVRKRRAISLI